MQIFLKDFYCHYRILWFAGKSSCESCSIWLSNVISSHIIPIWQYSMSVLSMPRPMTACLTCHCVGWCDAMLNRPICSRLGWHKGKLIGVKHEEKGSGPGVWQGIVSENLNYCPQNGPESTRVWRSMRVCLFSAEYGQLNMLMRSPPYYDSSPMVEGCRKSLLWKFIMHNQ